ncbi:transmembrane protein, putative [Medicago truncatula]|uniref:Transmembrane protein, putative n=1 Tax=Medicago truncatula TaxID=3880 RepID=G7J471_MEDTR|nr:transmembrane protein, putative [Medicago truncatula]
MMMRKRLTARSIRSKCLLSLRVGNEPNRTCPSSTRCEFVRLETRLEFETNIFFNLSSAYLKFTNNSIRLMNMEEIRKWVVGLPKGAEQRCYGDWKLVVKKKGKRRYIDEYERDKKVIDEDFDVEVFAVVIVVVVEIAIGVFMVLAKVAAVVIVIKKLLLLLLMAI